MKKEEYDILGLKKTKEGKSYDTIKKEINNLELFQKETKTNKKIIIKQQREINKLNNKIDKLNKKIFNFGLRDKSKKETKNIILEDLNKVIATVSFSTVPKQEIKVLCNLKIKKLNCILNHLKRYEIIKESRKNGVIYYKKC